MASARSRGRRSFLARLELLEPRYLMAIDFEDFNGTQVPLNGDGDTYPSWTDGTGGEGGQFNASINSTDAVTGHSLELDVLNVAGTGNALYAQFNPYNYNTTNGLYDNPPLPERAFARDYAIDSALWQFNTYDRMSFWLKVPTNAVGLQTDGTVNYNIGLYDKSVANADPTSDEAGGHHYYDGLDIPNGAEAGGQWIQVVINMHPSHERGSPGGYEEGNQPHPTGEANYNYFDTLTRWYLQQNYPNVTFPAKFLIDDIQFWQSPYPEDDDQVYNLVGVYNPANNRVIVTWNRNKNEDSVNHEVRYLIGPQSQDPHAVGWNNLTAAPNGILSPPGSGGYNEMVYDTTAIPGIANAPGVWIAIKPQNSSTFSTIYVRNFSYTGSSDTTPPTISSVASSNVTASGATVAWMTNEGADSQVEYGTTTSYGNSTTLNTSLVTSHSVNLADLLANTTYHYRVKSKDAAGNLQTSGDFTFTTSAPDTTPPTISSVSASNVTTTGATIAWTTDEPADSQVAYGTTASYGSSSALASRQVTSHSVNLTNLQPGTTYHYQVLSRDASGNLAKSADLTFTTVSDTTPPTISGVSASNISASSATIGWTTNEPATGQVEYGATTGYGTSTSVNASLLSSHAIVLSGLATNTTYHYRVKSSDAAGNLQTSGDFTFATPPLGIVEQLSINDPVGSTTLTDSSGNGNNATLSSGASVVTDATRGEAISFNGAGSATVLNSNSLNITGSQITIAFWSNFPANSNDEVFLGKGGASGAFYQYGVEYDGNGAKTVDFYFGDTTGALQGPFSLSGVSTNAWNHIAFTYDGTNVKGYLNGTLKLTTPLSNRTILAANTNLVLGADPSLNQKLTGKLDDIVIANRAFSSSEIQQLDGPTTDTTPPTISGVASSNVTSSGGTITWTTNESSDTQIQYGTTTSYGMSSTLVAAMVTSHTVTLSGLAASTTYHYRVMSRDASGNLAVSGDFTFATGVSPPAAPAGLSGAAGDRTDTLSWSAPSGSTSYNVYRSTNSGGEGGTPYRTGLTSTSFTDTGLTNGTAYFYQVTAVNSGGESAKSSEVSVTPQGPPSGPAKFFVINGGSVDQTYSYDAMGNSVGSYNLVSGDSTPRGAASSAAKTNLWVVDANHNVYVYNASGALVGSWTAGGLSSSASLQGIATNGTDIWIVDSASDKVFKYAGAASRRSGSQNAISSFGLASGNGNAKGIVTDGTSIWVVNAATTDKVFKYTVSGILVGKWTIDPANSSPTGITIDPTNVQSIWIVDSGADEVFQYSSAASRASGSQNADATFALAPSNTNPQDIADPPADSASLATVARGSLNNAWISQVFADVSNNLSVPAGDLSLQFDTTNKQRIARRGDHMAQIHALALVGVVGELSGVSRNVHPKLSLGRAESVVKCSADSGTSHTVDAASIDVLLATWQETQKH